MKRSLITLCCFAVTLLFTTQIHAQQRTSRASQLNQNPSAKQKQALYRAADRGQKRVQALRIPVVAPTRSANTAGKRRPTLQQMKKAYLRKCAEIKQTRGNVTAAQYKKFQSDFARLEKDLDQHVRMHFADPGNQKGSQFSDCYNDCHTSFPGIGGGAGANRFACKFGCFVEATGGRNN